jgi:anti-sigma-K factor RskA
MIDERHEEAATLYVFDLLEGAELAAFEAELTRNAELRQLVDRLRETAAPLALTAPQASPSPALRARVLASIAAQPRGSASAAPNRSTPDNVVRVNFTSWLGWAAAACLAVTAAYFANQYVDTRGELVALRNDVEMTRVESQTLRQQLEAERILASRQITDLQKASDLARADWEKARQDLESQRTAVQTQIAELRKAGEAAGTEMQALRKQLETERLAATQQIASLQKAGDVANLKIAKLADLLGNSPQAVAIAVWNPLQQQGVLNVENLPVLQRDQDYQLWVIDPRYQNPVNGGVFTVDEKGVARVEFRPDQPVTAVTTFAISRERKGGVPKAEGPIVAAGTL